MAANPAFLITLYVICWWVALFCVLPVGIRGQHEVGEIEKGHDTGAPALPMLAKKALWASLLGLVFWAAAVVFVAFDPLKIRG
jgi:predicted secreted protein